MKHEDVDSALSEIDAPRPERIAHQDELKIPLLRYKRTSKAGLWLLVLPLIVAIASVLRHFVVFSSPMLDHIGGFIAAVDDNPVLTFLLPLIVLGLPCAVMVINLLAFSHFDLVRERRELLVTIKYRPVNIAIFLLAFATLAYFFLPDALSF